MEFSFGYSPWLLLLSAVLAGGLTYWSYRATVPALASGWRWLLGGLRFTSLFLICFLLLKPVVRHLSETEQPPILAVLLDDTRSMRVVSGAGEDTSAQAVRDRLRGMIESIQNDLPGEPRFYAFDRSIRPLGSAPVDSLTFDGGRSDIGAALDAVSETLQGENLRGIAVISDGQYNAGRTPVRVADRSPVPVHTVTVGDTARKRDLQVRSVALNDVAYVDTEVPVQVTLGADDVGGEQTTVSLRGGGSVLAESTVSLPTGTAEVRVDLTYRPESAGLKQLTVRAEAVPGEATTQNNRRTISQRVLESKRQVLLLGAAPSPTYAAVRRVIASDANTTVTARVPQKNGTYYGGPLPDSLSDFDSVVLAGFPGPSVSEDDVQRVAASLDAGTPALFLLDRQTDLAAWQSHFSSALPARPPSSQLQLTSAPFVPVASERTHPVFQISDAELRLFERLPPIAVPTSAWAPTPDATTLGHASRPSLSRTDPLLVVRRRAGHRTALFLGTDTWRWATLPSDLQAADPLWPGLLSNLLRWVSTQNDDRQVRVDPVTATFDGDRPVEFTGQVYDESMAPVSDASVAVTITDSAGTEYPHSMEPLGNGRYRLNVGLLPEGAYRYEAVAERAETVVGEDQGQFSVGALRVEYQDTRANPVLMQQLAARSGGTAYMPDNASALPGDLASASSFTTTVKTSATEAELWRTAVFLIVILVLLAAEWTLRKRFGLT